MSVSSLIQLSISRYLSSGRCYCDGLPGGPPVKRLSANAGDKGLILGLGRPTVYRATGLPASWCSRASSSQQEKPQGEKPAHYS